MTREETGNYWFFFGLMRQDWLNTSTPLYVNYAKVNVSPPIFNVGWQCCVFLVHKLESRVDYPLRKLKTSSPINDNVMEHVPRS